MLGGSIALFFSPITFSPLFFGSYKEKASLCKRKYKIRIRQLLQEKHSPKKFFVPPEGTFVP